MSFDALGANRRGIGNFNAIETKWRLRTFSSVSFVPFQELMSEWSETSSYIGRDERFRGASCCRAILVPLSVVEGEEKPPELFSAQVTDVVPHSHGEHVTLQPLQRPAQSHNVHYSSFRHIIQPYQLYHSFLSAPNMPFCHTHTHMHTQLSHAQLSALPHQIQYLIGSPY